MIIKQKKLFFHTASVILDDAAILDLYKSANFSSIVGLSYQKLDLPHFREYSKPTLLIDLKKTEDEIMSSFNDTTRNEIRKTYKIDGLEFSSQEGVSAESYEIYKAFEYSQKRVPVSIDVLSNVMSFEAKLHGEVISGIYVLVCDPYLRIRSIFSKRTQVDQKEVYNTIGYATRRLVWNICEWGKSKGYHSLDMASVNIDNPKTQSIARFKMSFGKELIPEYTYIYKSFWFSIFERFVFIKIFLYRLFRR